MDTVEALVLVERSINLEDLTSQFTSVTGGKGHAVFLMGEAGVGKTSLVNHFLNSLGTSAVIYNGACDPLFTPRPLGPLYDVAQHIGSHFLKLLKNEKDRAIIFASFLEELSTSVSPVILIFEDVHWADDATADFIKFLCRRINRFKCLFLITYRDQEIHKRHPLRNIFSELPAADFSKMTLQPFSREAVEKLVLAKGYSSAENIYTLTGGNPFYVTEILASYSPGIPERVKDAILAVFNTRDEYTQKL